MLALIFWWTFETGDLDVRLKFNSSVGPSYELCEARVLCVKLVNSELGLISEEQIPLSQPPVFTKYGQSD